VLAHLTIRVKDAEVRASDAARDTRGYSWKKWSSILSEYMTTLEHLFYPDLFVIGGGAAKNSAKFLPHLDVRTPTVIAKLGNNAGIVGAALAVTELLGEKDELQSHGKKENTKASL
jgi:polyphosphate glucokinase